MVTSSFHSKFDNPKQFVGFSTEHGRGYGSKNRFFDGGFTFFIKENATGDDSSKLSWTSNNGYGLYKFDLLPKDKTIDFYISAGAFYGYEKIQIDKDSKTTYRKICAGLVPQTELRIQLVKKISIGIEGCLFYDLTNSTWKRTKGDRIYDLDISKFSGTSLKFFVGWCWAH